MRRSPSVPSLDTAEIKWSPRDVKPRFDTRFLLMLTCKGDLAMVAFFVGQVNSPRYDSSIRLSAEKFKICRACHGSLAQSHVTTNLRL